MHVEGSRYFKCTIALDMLMKMYYGIRQSQLNACEDVMVLIVYMASMSQPKTNSRCTTQKLVKLYLAFMTFGSFSHLLVCRL